MSAMLRVPEHVARNPIAKAIERTRLKKFFTDVGLDIVGAKDGEPHQSMLRGVAECIAIAIKAIEGIDDPQDIGGEMVDAMELIVGMSADGFRWRSEHAGALIDALDAAIQVLTGVDPADRIRGWEWAQEINRKMAQKAEA